MEPQFAAAEPARAPGKIIDTGEDANPARQIGRVEMGGEVSPVAIRGNLEFPRLDRRLGQAEPRQRVGGDAAHERLDRRPERPEVAEQQTVPASAVDGFLRDSPTADRGWPEPASI